MKRTTKPIELYVLYVAAGLSGFISLLDLFGLLDGIPWLAARVPTITLLLVSILLGYLTSGIVNKLDNLQSYLLALQSYVQSETTAQILSLRKQVDPNLEAVFGEQISNLLASVERALKERSIQLEDVDLFRYFYKRTLEQYPRATFFATSLPYQRYFWKNQPIEQAIAHFIAGGGKMKRLFFLNEAKDLNNEEVKEILATQCNIGVEVYVVELSNVPLYLRRFFLVDSKERIAWETFAGPDHRIVRVVATSHPESTKNFVRMFKELLELHGTRRYSPVANS